MNENDVLASQIRYYDARASAYEDFWHRRGDYALPPEQERAWHDDAARTLAFVHDRAHGETLELAAGTGIFTRVLARAATSVHAVDASPAMLAMNRRVLPAGAPVRYEQADLFTWAPDHRYDTVFFGFWLSHVPEAEWSRFWGVVGRCLKPNGHVVLVDSRPLPGRDASDVRTETRTVGGRGYRIVKRYWTPDALTAALARSGWSADLDSGEHHLMLRGTVRPA